VSPLQNASAPMPSGVTAPTPVTTTRVTNRILSYPPGVLSSSWGVVLLANVNALAEDPWRAKASF
jgi:hypothetical protein